jgi:hypothetical protein
MFISESSNEQGEYMFSNNQCDKKAHHKRHPLHRKQTRPDGEEKAFYGIETISLWRLYCRNWNNHPVDSGLHA